MTSEIYVMKEYSAAHIVKYQQMLKAGQAVVIERFSVTADDNNVFLQTTEKITYAMSWDDFLYKFMYNTVVKCKKVS